MYRLYDVAWDIDLVKVEAKVREYKRQSIDRKRFSKAFEFANPPLSLKLRTFDKGIQGKQYPINAYAKAYDYGVLSIIFEIPGHDELGQDGAPPNVDSGPVSSEEERPWTSTDCAN